MRISFVIRRLLQAGLPVLLWLSAISTSWAASDIRPADVFDLVSATSQELESIRFVTGQPRNLQTAIDVADAAPREVYFQALTLFRKVDRLSFEHTRRRQPEPAVPDREITPADVHQVVQASLIRLQQIRRELAAPEPSTRPTADPNTSPTEVFVALVQANRQLNLLLEKRFAPSDVFEQLTQGVGYASRLLERFPNAELVPAAPQLEPGRLPADVYRRLVDCYERIRRITLQAGLSALQLKPDEETIRNASPSDVYDIAALLVAELAHLHQQLPDAASPRKVYYVGRKFPSDVYQRAGILEIQLMQLEDLSQQQANWLTARLPQ